MCTRNLTHEIEVLFIYFVDCQSHEKITNGAIDQCGYMLHVRHTTPSTNIPAEPTLSTRARSLRLYSLTRYRSPSSGPVSF